MMEGAERLLQQQTPHCPVTRLRKEQSVHACWAMNRDAKLTQRAFVLYSEGVKILRDLLPYVSDCTYRERAILVAG